MDPPTRKMKNKSRLERQGSFRSQEQCWTTTKCLRLLRPLTSRIEPLIKLHAIVNPQENTDAKARKHCDAKNGPNTEDNESSRLRYGNAVAAKIQYASKARATQAVCDLRRHTGLASGFSLPTPLRPRKTLESMGNSNFPAAEKGSDATTPLAATHVDEDLEDDAVVARAHMRVKEVLQLQHARGRNAKSQHDLTSSATEQRAAYAKIAMLQIGFLNAFEASLGKTTRHVIDTVTLPEKPHGADVYVPVKNSRGCKSLFSTCLRKVPDYILYEQKARAMADPDDKTDVVTEVYDELEALSTSNASGWHGLGVVVRAHAMALAERAISVRLVSQDFRIYIMNTHAGQGTSLEINQLACAYANSLDIPPPLNRSASLWDPRGARLFSDRPGIWEKAGETASVLLSLLERDRLPVIWLGTVDSTVFLQRITAYIGVADVFQSTGARFIETLISSALIYFERLPAMDSRGGPKTKRGLKHILAKCPNPKSQHGLDQTLINNVQSLITVLAAIASLWSTMVDVESEPPSVKAVRDLLRGLVVQLLGFLRKCGDKYHEPSLRCDRSLSTSLLLSVLLMQGGSTPALEESVSVDIDEILVALHTLAGPMLPWEPNELIEPAAVFFADVAICCTKKRDSSGSLGYLKRISCTLLRIAKDRGSKNKDLLEQMAMATTLEHASREPSAGSRLFAREVEAYMQDDGAFPSTDSSRIATPARRGWKFEIGLSEWIAATPEKSERKGLGKMWPTRSDFDAVHSPSRSLGSPLRHSSLAKSSPLAPQEFNDSGYISDTSNIVSAAKTAAVQGLATMETTPQPLRLKTTTALAQQGDEQSKSDQPSHSISNSTNNSNDSDLAQNLNKRNARSARLDELSGSQPQRPKRSFSGYNISGADRGASESQTGRDDDEDELASGDQSRQPRESVRASRPSGMPQARVGQEQAMRNDGESEDELA